MKKDFMIGADVSSLQAMIDNGAKYYDFDGNEADALEILKRHGVNFIRLRIWNDPKTSFDRGDYCNLANTISMAKKIKEYGLGLMLDFHYSDSWADWGSQRMPKEWEKLSYDELCGCLYDYTKEVLETLYKENAYPDIVQIGNEIGYGLLWEHGRIEHPDKLVTLLNQGIKAVNDSDTGGDKAKIMLHLECGGDAERTERTLGLFREHGVLPYDFVGLSYYPYWSGEYPNLLHNMRNIEAVFNKKVVVVETAFPYTDESHDEKPNVVGGELTKKAMNLEPSEENQKRVLEDIIWIVNHEKNGFGVFYWEPVWYCLKGVGVMKGLGNEWENQALFDSNGKALQGLLAFDILHQRGVQE